MKLPSLQDLLKRRFKVRFEDLPSDRYADVNHVEDVENQFIDVIRINLKRKTEPARSLLHELIHLHCPELSEADVLLVERKIWHKLTQYERWMVYRRMFRKGWEGGPVKIRKLKI